MAATFTEVQLILNVWSRYGKCLDAFVWVMKVHIIEVQKTFSLSNSQISGLLFVSGHAFILIGLRRFKTKVVLKLKSMHVRTCNQKINYGDFETCFHQRRQRR